MARPPSRHEKSEVVEAQAVAELLLGGPAESAGGESFWCDRRRSQPASTANPGWTSFID